MKIDTKKCMPVPKDSVICKENANPFIPKDKEDKEKKDNHGRQVTFIPEFIVTPTLTSERIARKQSPPKRLSEDEVEDLSKCISKMLITDKTAKAEDDDDKKDHAKKPSGGKKDPLSPPLGRFEVDVISEESKSIVRVVRSLRLAAA